MSFRNGLAALALLLTVARASALDLLLPNGTQYTNIQLREKSDLGIRIAHATGVTFIDYLSLAPRDQYTFGYDEALYRLQRSRLAAPSVPIQQPTLDPNARFLPKYTSSTAPVPAGATAVSTPAATPDTTSAGTSLYRSSASSGQCAATTKKGYRCSRRASAGGYCWQHGR